MSNVVWSAEKGWHDGPEVRMTLDNGRIKAENMSDQTYNGWINYPTWAVNMWLSNDKMHYRYVSEAARVADKNGEESGFSRFLKDFVCDDLAPYLGASFAADLLGYALGEVDWAEIATAWLNEVEA